MHAVFVVVFIQVVASAVVVVVKRGSDADAEFNGVGDTIAVPVVVGPVHDTVVVMVPCGLLFAPETASDLFLINVQPAVVVVVRVFAIGNSVVVVVHVVEAWRSQALRHDALVPNGLEEAVTVSVGVVAVVVVVVAVCTREEIPVVLTGVVVKVEVAVDLKVIPNTVVVVVDIKPVEDGIVVVVKVDGGVGEIAVNIAIQVVLQQVSAQLVWEIGLRAVIAVPLPNAGRETYPCDVCISVVAHLTERDTGIDGSVAAEIVVPATDAFDRGATPVSRRSAGRRALIKGSVRASGIGRTKLCIDAVQRHFVCEGVSVAANESLTEVACGPTAG